MRRVFLLRHAKSSWDEPTLADHERPLAPRGRRAAGRMAGHMRREGIRPALVLCSTARRTRDTLEAIRSAIGEGVQVEIERDLYGASAEELLERLRLVPDEIGSVLMIGHNPGIQDLALCLTGRSSGHAGLREKFPTGALATLATRAEHWADLEPGGAGLVGFVVPRELR